jgi:alanine racemase
MIKIKPQRTTKRARLKCREWLSVPFYSLFFTEDFPFLSQTRYTAALYSLIYLALFFMSRPIVAHIDLNALQCNYALVKRRVAPARTFAVIKANAYGHGALAIAQALKNEADGFALIEIETACKMRAAGIHQPILLLAGVFEEAELLLCQQHTLMITVHNIQQVEWLERLAGVETGLHVFLKINTGMNRLGLMPDDIDPVLRRLQALPTITSICLMTHFATADESDKGIEEQWAVFDALRQPYVHLPFCAANSAAVMRYPHTHGQWVRPGVVLYGSSPFIEVTADELGLYPVMHLSSQLIAVQNITPGQTIGYGATYRADKPMRVGIVACGYADGYPRHAPAGTPIAVEGQRCALVGRVSMDMLAVDITCVPQAHVGTQVELWGGQVSIDEVASLAGTISYELMCAVASRVTINYSEK